MNTVFASRVSLRAPRRQSLRVCAQHTVQLRFTIKQKLDFGKRLCVVGSPKELGVWNAAESTCSLSWSEGDVWVGDLSIAPGPVEFKLVQVSDHEVIWPSGNNVSLLIPDQASGVDVTGEGESLNLTILGNARESVASEDAADGDAAPEEPAAMMNDAVASTSAPTTAASSVEFETLELGRLEDMKVADLKKILKEKGLPVSGKKAELIERLASS